MRAVEINLRCSGSAGDPDFGLAVVAGDDLGDAGDGEAVIQRLKVERGSGCHGCFLLSNGEG